MASQLHQLPLEIRKKIFEQCPKRDLVNMSVCSKYWEQEVVPILWYDISIKHHHVEEVANGDTVNLKHTCKLVLEIYRYTDYENILRNCNPCILSSLTARGWYSDDVLQISEFFPMLKNITLREFKCLNFLPTLRHLISISLSNCDVADDLVEKICKLKDLRVLEFHYCDRVTGKCLEHISEIKQLEKLYVSGGHDIECEWFTRTIHKLKNIVHLEIPWSNIKDELFDLAAGNFQFLQRLNVRGNMISDSCLPTLSKLHYLKHLNIDHCDGISDKGLAFLPKLVSLKYLDLSDCPISDEGVVYLSQLISLTTLRLMECKRITDAGLQSISQLRNLQHLDIGFMWCATDKGFAHLKNLKHLRILMMLNLQVTDKSLEIVSQMNFLEELGISYCDNLTDDGLHNLTNLQRLKTLRVDGMQGVTKDGLIEASLPVPDYPF